MKSRIPLFVFAFVVGLAASQAQVPAPGSASRHHSLSLEAQSVANGGLARASNDSANHFSSDATVLAQHDTHETNTRTNVQASVRNLGTTADAVKLEWFFFAVPVGDTAHRNGAKEFVLDHGAQDLSVGPGGTETRLLQSKEARAVTERTSRSISGTGSTNVTYQGGFQALGRTTESGVKMKGWLVRLTDNGQLVAAHGSSQTYEDLAGNDAKLAELAPAPDTSKSKRKK